MSARRMRPLAALALAGMLTTTAAVAAVGGNLTGHGDGARLDGDQTAAVREQVKGGKARNVILLIGDGMGDSEITIARNYAYGAAGTFPGIDALPLTGQLTTYALDKSDGKPNYVADSASSATAWATGTKSYNGAISVDVADVDQRSILEIARANGLRTGNVSTAEIQDATPAVLGAHVSQRGCYAPSSTTARCPEDALENGGPGSITEQLLETRADVTLGGGAASFDESAAAGPWAGKTLLAQARDRGFRVVTDADGLSAVRSADQKTPLLGLFARGNLPTRWVGPVATQGGAKEPAVRCEENPQRTDATPDLAQLTSTAIELLDSPRAKKGFFLQVEGASIDKQDHAANPCGQIGETVDLDEAVQAALKFAKKDGDTLVIVTADHAHTSQIVGAGTSTPGLTRTLVTADGKSMTVAYGTSEVAGSQGHTGSQVRVAAYGPRAANVVGLSDQVDLFFTMRDALSLDPEAPTPGTPVIEKVSVRDGERLRGRETITARVGGDVKRTVIALSRDGKVVADNTRGRHNRVDGERPRLVLDTRHLRDGAYDLTVTATSASGRTAETSLDVTVRNGRR